MTQGFSGSGFRTFGDNIFMLRVFTSFFDLIMLRGGGRKTFGFELGFVF